MYCNTPPQCKREVDEVETVSEVLKKYKGKSLGKNIRNLMFRGYVEHSNLTLSYFLMNEMNIHLNVFRS